MAYLALGWVVTQVTSTVAPLLHLPDWMGSVVVWIGVIGFPFVIMFSWIYELTPEGLKRESDVDRSASITHITGRRIDYIIIGRSPAAESYDICAVGSGCARCCRIAAAQLSTSDKAFLIHSPFLMMLRDDQWPSGWRRNQ